MIENLSEFLKNGDAVVKELHKKIEMAKEHLTGEQKESLDNELSRASKDISKATDILKDLRNKI